MEGLDLYSNNDLYSTPYWVSYSNIWSPLKHACKAATHVHGDYDFSCPTMRTATLLAQAGINVFLYVFSHMPRWGNDFFLFFLSDVVAC